MEVSADNLRLLLGLKLKTLRQARGASLKDVAASAGVSISYLSEIEKGKKYPKPEKLLDLARALNVSFDDLVSQRVSEPLRALRDVIRSPLWREFPFHLFGIEPEDIIGLVAENPGRTGGLLRVLDEVARDYDLRTKHVLFAALRAYQQLRGNHFPELERAAAEYRERMELSDDVLEADSLADLLQTRYGYIIDRETITKHPELQVFRSVYKASGDGNGRPCLMVNNRLLPSQQAFLFAREIGFVELGLSDRPVTSSWVRVDRFEPVLNNFLASYFAGALLIPEDALCSDLGSLFSSPTWDPSGITALMERYRTTPEMLFYRLTEVLPRHFGIPDLYFMRFTQREGDERYHLTKVLNMSQVPMPHGLRRELDYGKRWRTIGGVQTLMEHRDSQVTSVAAQRSHFLESDTTFFEITVARPLSLGGGHSSVTLAFLMSRRVRERIAFVNDPSVPMREVRYDETGDRHRERVAALAELGVRIDRP